MKRFFLVLGFFYFTSCVNMAFADEIDGHISLQPNNCPLSGLVVEIDPKVGSPQPKVVTLTREDGSFTANVINGEYLVVVYQRGSKVFQSQIHVSGTTTFPIGLTSSVSSEGNPCTVSTSPTAGNSGTTPSTQVRFKIKRSGTPIDLALDPDGTFLALDSFGGVSRIAITQGGQSSETLFQLPPSIKPAAIASNSEYVFASANSVLGCQVYIWNKTNKSLTFHNLGQRVCSGIAVDGQQSIYVAFDEEVGVWTDLFISKPKFIGFPKPIDSATLALDESTRELFVSASDGTVYLIGQGKRAKRFSDIGSGVNSIGIAKDVIVVASADGLACYSRSGANAGRKISGCLDAKIRHTITGVRVDVNQRVWILDRDDASLIGPLPIQNR